MGGRIKTAWDAIVNAVRATLGVPANRTTALEALMRTTERAMEVNRSEPTRRHNVVFGQPEEEPQRVLSPAEQRARAVREELSKPGEALRQGTAAQARRAAANASPEVV